MPRIRQGERKLGILRGRASRSQRMLQHFFALGRGILIGVQFLKPTSLVRCSSLSQAKAIWVIRRLGSSRAPCLLSLPCPNPRGSFIGTRARGLTKVIGSRPSRDLYTASIRLAPSAAPASPEVDLNVRKQTEGRKGLGLALAVNVGALVVLKVKDSIETFSAICLRYWSEDTSCLAPLVPGRGK